MRRRTVQPEIRPFVSVLRSPVTPFHRSDEECELFRRVQRIYVQRKCERSAIQEGSPRKRCTILARKSAKLFANTKVHILARKSAKLIANFSATKVTSLPSHSLCISLSHRAHVTHNIGSASALPIILAKKKTSLVGHRFFPKESTRWRDTLLVHNAAIRNLAGVYEAALHILTLQDFPVDGAEKEGETYSPNHEREASATPRPKTRRPRGSEAPESLIIMQTCLRGFPSLGRKKKQARKVFL